MVAVTIVGLPLPDSDGASGPPCLDADPAGPADAADPADPAGRDGRAEVAVRHRGAAAQR